MTQYVFTQQVDYPDILISSIQASSIATPICSVQRDGSGPTMTVTLFFNDVLSTNDQTTLNNLMSSYVNSPNSSQQQISQIIKDMNFGQGVIAQFGAANRSANLTTEQVAQVAQQLAPIQGLLQSGSIETALAAIQALTPGTIITQQAITYYSTLLQNYLNGEQ